MEHIAYAEDGQKIPHFLWNPKVYFHIYISHHPYSQSNQVQPKIRLFSDIQVTFHNMPDSRVEKI